MTYIVAHDDVRSNRRERQLKRGKGWRTDFLAAPPGNNTSPEAFLAERSFEGGLPPHFHDVDQFQVIVRGGGRLGRHILSPHQVHFARAYTPYGPIVPAEEGLSFLTLRAHRAAGQFSVRDKAEMLKSAPDRRPWQVTEQPEFKGTTDVSVQTFSHIRNDDGLAAQAIVLKPNVTTAAPEPSGGTGQYLIVTNGSVLREGKDLKAITIIFVRPDESAFQLTAGAAGAEVLALNFPRELRAHDSAATPTRAAGSGLRVWQCQLCAFIYDEAKGMPDEGIARGTRWEDVPPSWTCPDCAATKSDFDMAVVA